MENRIISKLKKCYFFFLLEIVSVSVFLKNLLASQLFRICFEITSDTYVRKYLTCREKFEGLKLKIS